MRGERQARGRIPNDVKTQGHRGLMQNASCAMGEGSHALLSKSRAQCLCSAFRGTGLASQGIACDGRAVLGDCCLSAGTAQTSRVQNCGRSFRSPFEAAESARPPVPEKCPLPMYAWELLDGVGVAETTPLGTGTEGADRSSSRGAG